MHFSISIGTPRLLLVEDHAGRGKQRRDFLQSEGFDVRLASSGREALGAAVAFQPDIVLCDLHLPDMSGLDVLSALRENSAVGRPLLVIYTPMPWMGDQGPHAPQADLFLSKPLDSEKLVMLRAELRRFRGNRNTDQSDEATGAGK